MHSLLRHLSSEAAAVCNGVFCFSLSGWTSPADGNRDQIVLLCFHRQPSLFLIRLSWTQPVLHLIFSTCSAEEGEWETSWAGIWVPKFSFPLSLHSSVQTRKAPPIIPPRDHQTLNHWSFSTYHRDMSHILHLVRFCPLCALDVKCKGWGKG